MKFLGYSAELFEMDMKFLGSSTELLFLKKLLIYFYVVKLT